MSAAYIRKMRPATTAELDALRKQSRTSGFGVLAVLGLPFAATCSLIGEGVGGSIGAAVGALVAAALAFSLWLSYYKDVSQIRARARKDLQSASVEVLALTDAVAVNIPATHSSVDPAFAIELQGGRTLLLVGPCLSEPSTFGGDWNDLSDDDGGDAFANTLPPPYAFPTRAFTLHRFPHTGEVLRIELSGQYVDPVDIGHALDLRLVNGMPSRLLECTLADLPEEVERLRTGRSS